MEQVCGEGGYVGLYEGWPAPERKRSWRVSRRLETGSRQWIGQRTLFKLVGQRGLAKHAQSGQDDSSSNIRQGNTGVKEGLYRIFPVRILCRRFPAICSAIVSPAVVMHSYIST